MVLKAGWVWIEHIRLRPFVKYSIIKAGKNKGKVMVFFSDEKIIVEKDQIRFWPEAE